MYLVTSEQMRCFDHDTIETHHVPSIVLMDHAARAVAESVLQTQFLRVVVACGKGNNGGDGWLAARWIHRAGRQVSAVTSVHPTTLTGDALTAFRMAEAIGVPWCVYTAGSLSQDAEIIVDALLGTGGNRPLDHPYLAMVEDINASGAWVLSIDVPTGVDASTGEVPSNAVQANETVAMAYEKVGTAITPGAVYAGRVRVVDIGISPPSPISMSQLASYVRPADFYGTWGARSQLSHKGTYGRCGVYVGQMPGAAMLAASGAARVGAGLVVLGGHVPESMLVPPDFVQRSEPDAIQAFRDCDAVVIGPGLGVDLVATVERVQRAPSFRQIRGVIDADGLLCLVGPNGLASGLDTWVLTPHPKEMARMLGWTTEAVQAHRLKAAKQLARLTGAVVLLKGYRTIVARPDGTFRINPTGDASLAVGGSGDVLAGVVGSLMAQGLHAFDAASLGAWLHGCAGEIAGALWTSISTTATDVVDCLPRAVARYLEAKD